MQQCKLLEAVECGEVQRGKHSVKRTLSISDSVSSAFNDVGPECCRIGMLKYPLERRLIEVLDTPGRI